LKRELLCIAVLGLAGRLGAWGGSPLTWLNGTQPWDTTPYNEVDVSAVGAGGDGQGRGGLAAQWGIVDELQTAAQWLQPLDGSKPSGECDLRLREEYFPDWRPAFSIYGRAPYVDGAWTGWGGLSAAMEPFQMGLAANAEAGDGGRWRLRLALSTPYLLYVLRFGAEASWLDGSAEAFTPQCLINAPGDISLMSGVRLDAQGGAPVWTARLSYEIFPSP
jgi:hypothetical protein